MAEQHSLPPITREEAYDRVDKFGAIAGTFGVVGLGVSGSGFMARQRLGNALRDSIPDLEEMASSYAPSVVEWLQHNEYYQAAVQHPQNVIDLALVIGSAASLRLLYKVISGDYRHSKNLAEYVEQEFERRLVD